jgi:hypothetical protein
MSVSVSDGSDVELTEGAIETFALGIPAPVISMTRTVTGSPVDD